MSTVYWTSNIIVLFYLVSFVVGVYCLVLLIKLARRGIRALDIYIEKNRNDLGV